MIRGRVLWRVNDRIVTAGTSEDERDTTPVEFGHKHYSTTLGLGLVLLYDRVNVLQLRRRLVRFEGRLLK